MIDLALRDHIRSLADEYAADVQRRQQAGDKRAEYHAQQPKVKAYGALMKAGLTPREAVEYFRAISVLP
jgi:hypothetical protein